MLNSVLGAISSDLALDIGSHQTRVAQVGRGVVARAATCVAVLKGPDAERRVLAIGEEARRMAGRAPADIWVAEPVRDGAITDYEVVEALVRELFAEVFGRRLWLGPRVAVAVPYGVTDVERRAVREAVEAAGARGVRLVERPLAAALGAELPVHEARGHMVVDLGASGTQVSVLSLSGVVFSRQVPVGGEAMDRAIVSAVRERHGLVIPMEAARMAKHELGSALPPPFDRVVEVGGRDAGDGFPRLVQLTAGEVHEALAPSVEAIAEGVLATLERVPPDLAGDVAEMGIVLAGGGALLDGLDHAMAERTGMPVIVCEDAAGAVARGAAARLA